jgi:hypothetical protein
LAEETTEAENVEDVEDIEDIEDIEAMDRPLLFCISKLLRRGVDCWPVCPSWFVNVGKAFNVLLASSMTSSMTSFLPSFLPSS